MVNLPKLEYLKLEKINFRSDELPKTLKTLILWRFTPTDNNIIFSSLERLEIKFDYGYMDCSLQVKDVNELKIDGTLSKLFVENVKEIDAKELKEKIIIN